MTSERDRNALVLVGQNIKFSLAGHWPGQTRRGSGRDFVREVEELTYDELFKFVHKKAKSPPSW